MTIDEDDVKILERYVNWSYCEEIDMVGLKDWLTTDIVRMIELMDAELQQRASDAEQDLYGHDGTNDLDYEEYL